MKVCSTADLRETEVINRCDGERLGYVTDFEIDLCDAKIISLILPSEIGLFGCPKGDELVIPWDKIECIGEDAILVRLSPSEIYPAQDRQKKKRSFW